MTTNMPEIVYCSALKIIEDDLEVEFQIEDELLSDNAEFISVRNSEIETEIAEINKALQSNDKKLETINSEIDRLTNNAEKIDYIIAVASGVLAGIIDSLWVGEFSFDRGREWSDVKANNFVVKIAQSQGYSGDNLEDAVKHLENKFPLSSDSNTSEFGGGRQHHLRDFAHHPSPVGLIFSMLTQFTGKAYGTGTDGSFKIVETKNKIFIGKDLPQKFLFGAVFWFFHMVSDIAGSSRSISEGVRGIGLPGPLVSLAKSISTLPIFKETDEKGNKIFSVWVSKLFNGSLFSERDTDGKIIKDSVKNFDLRSEIGVAYELGHQAIPVFLNECIVRGFYFIRRIIFEISSKNIKRSEDLKRIDWNSTLPFKNRTIVRMLTISTGTFIAIDLADAAIRSAIKNGPPNANLIFLKDFILRVNFVGIGRFAFAVATDISMGVKREKLRNERIVTMSQQLHLLNAKVFYLQANMWNAAESTAKTIEEVKTMMESTAKIAVKTWQDNRDSMDKIGAYGDGVKNNNIDLFNDIKEILDGV